MTPRDILLDSFQNGKICLLLGEEHTTMAAYKALQSMLPTLQELHKQKHIIIIAEISSLKKNIPYAIDDIPQDMKKSKQMILKEILSTGIPVYGCENSKTHPFENLNNTNEIDQKLKDLGLFHLLTPDAELLRGDLEEYRYLAMSIYAQSPLRITIPNEEFSKFISDFPDDNFCIFIGGSKHIPAFIKDGQIEDPGMFARLVEVKNAVATFVTEDEEIKSPYIPSSDGDCTYGPIINVTYLPKTKLNQLSIFSDKSSRDEEAAPPISKKDTGSGCKIA